MYLYLIIFCVNCLVHSFLIKLITKFFYTGRRKSNTFLDVPSISFQNASGDEDDTITLRTFSSSNKGNVIMVLKLNNSQKCFF